MRFFTHFDRNYLPQARVMVESLLRHASEDVYINCVFLEDTAENAKPNLWPRDSVNFWTLRSMLGSGGVVGLSQAREDRSWQEFCWTMEPAILKMDLRDGISDITVYVDADSYFFADPCKSIRGSMELAVMGLTPHHFPTVDSLKTDRVGRFNFGLCAYRGHPDTNMAVDAWYKACLNGCSSSTAGQQKYLDRWPHFFGSKFVELHRGLNVGPWQKIYACPDDHDRFICDDGEGRFDLISYHFHEFRRGNGRNPIQLAGEDWNRTNYEIWPSVIELVYKPYEQELESWIEKLR